MKRNFLVGVFFTVSVLIGFGQTLKTSLNPSIVNGKLQLTVVLENNTGQPIIPAESNFVAFFDTNFADYSSMVLFSANPKWTDNDYYEPITLERLLGVEDSLV